MRQHQLEHEDRRDQACLQGEPGKAATYRPEPHPRPGQAAAQRHVPGVDVKAGPRPPGALLQEFAHVARHVLVRADARVDHHAVTEPPDLHGEVGILAIHPDREAAGDDRGPAAEGGEGTGNDDDAVDHALAQPFEPELEQGLQGAQPVEPGHGIGPRLFHGAHGADERIAKPGYGVGQRIRAHDAVRVDADDDLGVGDREPAVERGRLAGVRSAQDLAARVGEGRQLGPRDLRGVVD